MSALKDRLTTLLDSRASRQILRSLSPSPIEIPLVDFSSNDYLSFSHSPLLKQKLLRSLLATPPNESPYGPPSSRLLDGNTTQHLLLEDRLAAFFCGDAGLLFNSGFDANVGIWTCLPDKNDIVLYDKLIHASTHDGMRASRVPAKDRRSFEHNSVEDLERLLLDCCEEEEGVKEGLRSVWVTTETLFSMDGDLAPLKEIVECVERCLPRGNGHLVVDEAHSTGLYGENGRGVVCALGLANRITVRVHTFGKAMACTGAIVLCNPLIRSYLINYARPLIYSTVMPYMNVLAIANSLEMLEQGHGVARATHVHQLSALFLSLLAPLLASPTSTLSLPPALPQTPPPPASLATTKSILPAMLLTTPIVPLLSPTPREFSKYLNKAGFLVRPITYPTVPKGQERVRICLHADNSTDDVRRLVEVIERWLEEGSSSKSIAKL